MIPTFLWLFKTHTGEIFFLLNYIQPQNSAHSELLRRFYIIAFVALPFWTIPNFSWYAYQKRLADIVVKKELIKRENNPNNSENTYKKFIYNTLILSKPANNEYKNFAKIMGKKNILAVKVNDNNEVLVYTNQDVKTIKGKAYFIINKIKNDGGVQLGDKLWVKPDAIVEMKPVKNGHGIILSSGHVINMPSASLKASLPKRLVERALDDQQRQRA
ncbi:MAG: hypothetical protein AB7U85_03850 [Alphaproteobacteria bacterium]